MNDVTLTLEQNLQFINSIEDSESLFMVKQAVNLRLERLRDEEVANWKKQGKLLAQRFDLQIDTLLDNVASKHDKGGSVKAKYGHPTNSELTWAGRGKHPNWVTQWLQENPTKTLDDLLLFKPDVRVKDKDSATAESPDNASQVEAAPTKEKETEKADDKPKTTNQKIAEAKERHNIK